MQIWGSLKPPQLISSVKSKKLPLGGLKIFPISTFLVSRLKQTELHSLAANFFLKFGTSFTYYFFQLNMQNFPPLDLQWEKNFSNSISNSENFYFSSPILQLVQIHQNKTSKLSDKVSKKFWKTAKLKLI